jgi:hypothetical protein
MCLKSVTLWCLVMCLEPKHLGLQWYMDGFSSNLGWTYYTSQQVARDTYFSRSRTARTCASARVRARAWLTVSIFMDGLSSYRAHVCERGCERAHGFTVNYLWTDSLQMWWAHTTKDRKLHGIHTYHVQSLRACVRVRAWVCERECD